MGEGAFRAFLGVTPFRGELLWVARQHLSGRWGEGVHGGSEDTHSATRVLALTGKIKWRDAPTHPSTHTRTVTWDANTLAVHEHGTSKPLPASNCPCFAALCPFVLLSCPTLCHHLLPDAHVSATKPLTPPDTPRFLKNLQSQALAPCHRPFLRPTAPTSSLRPVVPSKKPQCNPSLRCYEPNASHGTHPAPIPSRTTSTHTYCHAQSAERHGRQHNPCRQLQQLHRSAGPKNYRILRKPQNRGAHLIREPALIAQLPFGGRGIDTDTRCVAGQEVWLALDAAQGLRSIVQFLRKHQTTPFATLKVDKDNLRAEAIDESFWGRKPRLACLQLYIYNCVALLVHATTWCGKGSSC